MCIKARRASHTPRRMAATTGLTSSRMLSRTSSARRSAARDNMYSSNAVRSAQVYCEYVCACGLTGDVIRIADILHVALNLQRLQQNARVHSAPPGGLHLLRGREDSLISGSGGGQVLELRKYKLIHQRQPPTWALTLLFASFSTGRWQNTSKKPVSRERLLVMSSSHCAAVASLPRSSTACR